MGLSKMAMDKEDVDSTYRLYFGWWFTLQQYFSSLRNFTEDFYKAKKTSSKRGTL